MLGYDSKNLGATQIFISSKIHFRINKMWHIYVTQHNTLVKIHNLLQISACMNLKNRMIFKKQAPEAYILYGTTYRYV